MNERARRHFDRIALALADDDAKRMDEALSVDAWTRMEEGLRMGAAVPTDEAIEAELDRRALGQAELHVRFRRLARRRGHGR